MGTTFSNHDIHPTLACDPTEVRIPSYSSLYDQLKLTPDQHGTDVGSGGGHDAGTKKEENHVEEEEGRGAWGGVRGGMMDLMMKGQ
jgi:hypothetical protein